MPSIELIAAVTALLGALPPLIKLGLAALYKSSSGARKAFDTSLGKAILKTLDIPEGVSSPTKDLLADLRKASTEMDRIVHQIGQYTQERQSTVMKLEGDLQALSQQEQELKKMRVCNRCHSPLLSTLPSWWQKLKRRAPSGITCFFCLVLSRAQWS